MSSLFDLTGKVAVVTGSSTGIGRAIALRMAELSSDIAPMDKVTPAGLKNFLESEIAKWGPVIKKAGIYAD